MWTILPGWRENIDGVQLLIQLWNSCNSLHCLKEENGVRLTVQDLLHQDTRIQDFYFNISEMKLSITSLYIISVATKYDIIWTENENLIDRFLPEILTFKKCSKHVQHVFDRFWTRFEHFLIVNISGMKLSITSLFLVQIMSYLVASDRPIK